MCVLAVAKGSVLRSQLPKEDLVGVTLFLRANCLLRLSSVQRVHQIVIWREVGGALCVMSYVVSCDIILHNLWLLINGFIDCVLL